MEVKVATTTSFHWSGRHTTIPQCPSFSQTLTSSKLRRSRGRTGDVTVGGSLTCQKRLKPSTFLGAQSGKLHRSKSCELWQLTTNKIRTSVKKHNPLRRVCSASSSFFSDEAFSIKMQELALQFRISGEEEDEVKHKESEIINEAGDNDNKNHRFGTLKLLQEFVPGFGGFSN